MSYDSRGSVSGEGVCVGIDRAESDCEVHDLYVDFGAEPLVALDGDWCAVKFARRDDVSSVLDFSKNGRRITEGPPDMIFLKLLVEVVKGMETCARGGEYELHSDREQANSLTLGGSRIAYIVLLLL